MARVAWEEAPNLAMWQGWREKGTLLRQGWRRTTHGVSAAGGGRGAVNKSLNASRLPRGVGWDPARQQAAGLWLSRDRGSDPDPAAKSAPPWRCGVGLDVGGRVACGVGCWACVARCGFGSRFVLTAARPTQSIPPKPTDPGAADSHPPRDPLPEAAAQRAAGRRGWAAAGRGGLVVARRFPPIWARIPQCWGLPRIGS